MSDLIETAKKLMALDDFRWWDGMPCGPGPYDSAERVLRVVGDLATTSEIYDDGFGNARPKSRLVADLPPIDLNDPATQGCVMAWCAEVFGPSFHVVPRVNPTGSFVYQAQRLLPYTSAFIEVTRLSDECPTRIEAACAALLGAR